ncbi:MAG: AAA family ATPase, partial [Muribaculaceae bacterium]|nr:AAA family ATPase [Muribaculaceae bacterium]
MEQMRLYPVGEQDFEVMRTMGMVYVDKTAYIYRMVHDGARTVFLSRPRRFGKTLLCNTLKHFFLGHRDLFKGLAIDSLEKDWTVYPVLHFDMSKAKNDDVNASRVTVGTMLREYEDIYGRCPDSDGLGDRLRYIIEQAHRQTGQKVVLIFDEYDSPVLNVIDSEEKQIAMRSLFNEFYGPVKSMYEHLRFVFITGITKFSQMSIFSSINNISNITMDAAYEG